MVPLMRSILLSLKETIVRPSRHGALPCSDARFPVLFPRMERSTNTVAGAVRQSVVTAVPGTFLRRKDFAELAEQFHQVVFRRVVRQITDIELLGHCHCPLRKERSGEASVLNG